MREVVCSPERTTAINNRTSARARRHIGARISLCSSSGESRSRHRNMLGVVCQSGLICSKWSKAHASTTKLSGREQTFDAVGMIESESGGRAQAILAQLKTMRVWSVPIVSAITRPSGRSISQEFILTYAPSGNHSDFIILRHGIGCR